MEQDRYDRLLEEGGVLLRQLNDWYSRLRALETKAQAPEPIETAKTKDESNLFVSASNHGLSDFVPVSENTFVVGNHIDEQEENTLHRMASVPTVTANGDDIAKQLSVIDYFHFKRELFAEDSEEMNRVLNELSALNNVDDAMEYMRQVLRWDTDNDSVAHLAEILREHFSRR